MHMYACVMCIAYIRRSLWVSSRIVSIRSTRRRLALPINRWVIGSWCTNVAFVFVSRRAYESPNFRLVLIYSIYTAVIVEVLAFYLKLTYSQIGNTCRIFSYYDI